MNNHLSSECLHASTKCCEVDCNEVILRGEADMHAQDCQHRIVMCEACSASVKFKDLEVRGFHGSFILFLANPLPLSFIVSCHPVPCSRIEMLPLQ